MRRNNEQYDPYEQKKEISKKNKKKRHFYWSYEQNKEYSRFLERISEFQWQSLKENKAPLYSAMTKCISTRTKRQCRSHHQKMMLKHKTINGIIEYFKKLPQKNTQMNQISQVSQSPATNNTKPEPFQQNEDQNLHLSPNIQQKVQTDEILWLQYASSKQINQWDYD